MLHLQFYPLSLIKGTIPEPYYNYYKTFKLYYVPIYVQRVTIYLVACLF